MNAIATKDIIQRAKELESYIIDIRRRLHQCPELQYELHETSGIVCEELEKLGVEFESGIAQTGVVAKIGSGSGKCVMLRADMDALPMEEMADVEFKSRNEGRMHACGHDCHTAMLLGAAKLLKQQESQLGGTVKLCFQPAEEGGAGGKAMCEAGVMQNPKVDKVFGLHVWPMIPSGQLTGRPGPFLASTCAFTIVVSGKGGHAAMPHLCIDPVATAAKIIVEAQTLISREQDPLEGGVISCTAIHGGDAHNVIPQDVEIRGTIRSLSSANKDHLKARLEAIATAIGEANRCTVEFKNEGIDYPETSNDPELWQEVHAMGSSFVGDENFPICPPMMGGEDFAYYGAHAPTAFVALGIRNEAVGSIYGLHHPQFKADESILHLGTALHVAFVEKFGK